ncbi:MAG: DUF5343 domain-containing protein [Mycobacterium sp.]|uniref:DUF5343 domain-containing protein n=1 Tax=Mycobacterium sp. TaxID=1785 RepID=UPI00261DA26C|nr:DUF5343 domain-containing protein [Mycobacterium sp.]MDI3315990.1 DUF5343 domain-containing protein [Mycobacterium sp.]
MADSKIPYMNAYGNITRALEKIKTATTPQRFTQDFLETKIGLSGGSARPVIPYLKRTGFLNSDGTPTDIYVRFRNASKAGRAAAEALKKGYQDLYDIHEFVHDLDDKKLRDTILQATGWESDSGMVKAAVGSFKALRAFATFDEHKDDEADDSDAGGEQQDQTDHPGGGQQKNGPGELRLGYTINLNLPPTPDIAVFDAIFKSLKEHLL